MMLISPPLPDGRPLFPVPTRALTGHFIMDPKSQTRKGSDLRRNYRPQKCIITYQAQIVLEILGRKHTIMQMAAAHGIHRGQLRKWKAHAGDSLLHLSSEESTSVRAIESLHERKREE